MVHHIHIPKQKVTIVKHNPIDIQVKIYTNNVKTSGVTTHEKMSKTRWAIKTETKTELELCVRSRNETQSCSYFFLQSFEKVVCTKCY